MYKTFSLLLSLLGVLSLASGPVVAQSTDSTVLTSTFIEHDSGLVRLTLLRTGPISVALTASGADELAPDVAPSLLFTAAAVPHQIHGSLSAVQNADGTWTAAASICGGATMSLHVWRFELEVLEGGGFAKETFLAHQVIQSVSVGSSSGAPQKAGNFEAPSLFRSGEATVLFASAYAEDRQELMHERVVVLVKLSTDLPEVPEASLVGVGSDPKPVDLGDSVLLAVRRGANVPQALGEAQLSFLRSTDLATWTEDSKLSGAVARPTYSVVSNRGEFWLATWTDPEDPRVVVRSFDATRGEWATAAGLGIRPYRGSSPGDGVWLVPRAEPGARRPEVRYVCPDGSIARE